MENNFITYKQALSLKKLGFDEPCFSFYPKEGKMGFNGKYHSIKEGYRNSTVNDIWIKKYKKDFECIAAPTFSQAFRFFREKYDLHIGICHARNGKFDCWTNNGNLLGNGSYTEFETYEKAEDACIDKLIEIINENKEN